MDTLDDVRIAVDEAMVTLNKSQPGLNLNPVPQQTLAGGITAGDDAASPQDTATEEDSYEIAKKKVTRYFLETEAVFRRLAKLRQEV